MKVFTIESGTVTEGAEVTALKLKSGEISIPVIIVGEEGRGRRQGVLPIQLLPEQFTEWEDKGSTRVSFGKISQTRAGKPKILSTDGPDSDESIIAVMSTKIGYRGGNSHTGDWSGEEFIPFPGEMIIDGVIAEGDAGHMGSGTQMVAVMPKDVVWRTAYSGRLYGAPASHYYKWDGMQLLVLSEEEREFSELF